MPVHDFRLQMQSYDLTTADIDYRLPDIPFCSGCLFGREYNLAPTFRFLRKFLD